MPRTRSIRWSELKVGVIGLVAAALVMAIVLAVGGSGGFWWQRYPLRATFNDVQGLKPGAVVRVSGKEVGVVSSVEFAQPQVEVRLEVLRDVRPMITTESVAKIGSLSLLGDVVVDITPGRAGTPLGDNEYIKANQSAGPVEELTSSASASLDQIQGLLTDVRAGRGTLGKIVTDDALYREMQTFVASASSVTQAIQSGKGTLGALVKDPAAYHALESSLQNLQTITGRLTAGDGPLGRLLSDDAMGRSLASTTTNIDQVSGRLARGEGTAGKLLTDEQLYNRLNSMANRVDQVMAGVEAGRGTAGQLLHDPALYDNMNRAVGELRDLLAEIRKDPQKYLRVRVSIF